MKKVMEFENLFCSCERCVLKSLFFSHVSVGELNQICHIKVERSFSKGEVIIQQDEKIYEFMYMKEGLVKLSRKTLDNKDQIISFSKPFDFVSLLSIFSSETYNYTVTAIEDSVICSLNLETVKAHARSNALLAMDLMSKASGATDKIILENLEIKRKYLRGRVAHVMLYFAEYIYGSDEFELPVSRREIAEYIGMTTENVIRTLSEFRNDKVIKIFGKDILITDKKRLQDISEFG